MDAASDDGTREWLNDQCELIWRSEFDDGMYDAINKGWSIANGDIFSWLNTDEQYLPGTLHAVESIFRKFADVDFVYGNSIVIDPNARVLAARREIRLSRFYISNSFLSASSCTMFFRRRLWDEGILKFDHSLRFASDMDLILRLLAAGKRHYWLNRYLATFMLHDSNLSHDQSMLDETMLVQRRFSTRRLPLQGLIARTGRVIERFVAGSYFPVSLEFQYALDEVPNYLTVRSHRVGGRYATHR